MRRRGIFCDFRIGVVNRIKFHITPTDESNVGPDLGRGLSIPRALRCGGHEQAQALLQSHPHQRDSTYSARWLLGACFALLLVTRLTAHDIYSSWTESFVREDRLELTLTLARSSALRLIPDSAALPTITPENFASYEPHLKKAAPTLFAITTGGKQLTLTSSDVAISGDADVTFHLVYPRPPPGKLRFVAQYLAHLVDGHVGTLVVNDRAGKDLGWSPVSIEQPVFELSIPTSRQPPKR